MKPPYKEIPPKAYWTVLSSFFLIRFFKNSGWILSNQKHSSAKSNPSSESAPRVTLYNILFNFSKRSRTYLKILFNNLR